MVDNIPALINENKTLEAAIRELQKRHIDKYNQLPYSQAAFLEWARDVDMPPEIRVHLLRAYQAFLMWRLEQ